MNSPTSIAKKAPVFRWLPYVGVGALVALLALGLRPQPVTVETARAINGPLRATVSEEGKTRIRQRYVVSSPVTGQLRRVPFKPGAEITAASIVAVIEPLAASPLDPRSRALAETRRTAATAALEKSRTAHALATNELRRMTQMFADKTISPQDLETIQLRETAAARDLITTEGALRSIETELAETALGSGTSLVEVHAPNTGRVLHVFEESQRPITAGTPILDVGDPRDLEVVIELLSRDGAALTPGTRVELEQWGGPQPLEARVRLVEPAAFTKISALGVEEQRVNVVADIITPLTARPTLGDNFRVEARVVIWEEPQVLKVPVSALFRQNNNWAVYALRHGRAVLIPVQIGRSSGIETQVLTGLNADDEVILYPGDRITDNQRVHPVKI